ncbi:hypothetical protein 1 [Beihai hermit crab virus 3]|uniref:Uncharacterized protein n=1 Tax=Beihai hermit crab virus 3 TaxID=1922390 RepID=A0A1L3KMQ2_9VIRU|nr:hypothetical protein 1 [Beihai hermit crab virus 3]APG78636.1 hypothetical protein 1 [Beihai hermit crab virus 3]
MSLALLERIARLEAEVSRLKLQLDKMRKSERESTHHLRRSTRQVDRDLLTLAKQETLSEGGSGGRGQILNVYEDLPTSHPKPQSSFGPGEGFSPPKGEIQPEPSCPDEEPKESPELVGVTAPPTVDIAPLPEPFDPVGDSFAALLAKFN